MVLGTVSHPSRGSMFSSESSKSGLRIEKTLRTLQVDEIQILSSDLNVLPGNQLAIILKKSIDRFSQTPRRNQLLGTRTCRGLIITSLEAGLKIIRLLVPFDVEITVSRVKGRPGGINICITRYGCTIHKDSLSLPGILNLMFEPSRETIKLFTAFS